MGYQFEKCAIVVDKELPAGLAMNTVAALALSVGKFTDDIVGDDVKDADGRLHTGITSIPLPVLRADAGELRDVAVRALGASDVFVVDFTSVAQSSRSYDEYTRRTAEIPTGELPYIGVALCGSRKAVDRLTGSLPLYR
ncbi:DUF2000 domain-containing protein [Streptomyces prunicolor]|uniref:DUF2000 domain-containing protein n=1 Tax=Streptomyces prunicolor TaxID=67348 RepID=UPI0037CEB9CC|nr:DUF2000 domain-containing protein [Streptomyces prunicolor]WSV18253.1 DUF2000 domain-containing protein [Streptomyces prunicolor]